VVSSFSSFSCCVIKVTAAAACLPVKIDEAD